jgi:hypothetical protein
MELYQNSESVKQYPLPDDFPMYRGTYPTLLRLPDETSVRLNISLTLITTILFVLQVKG